MAGYDAKAIEAKWQAVWAEEKTWEVPNPGQPGFDASKPKSYVLEMLPYPSGEPHVGHLKCYAVGDAIAHFRRRHGYEVIHPMGYDAFGLPAENNAIKTGEPPREATERSIESFRRQFREWGISIDWSRELGTHTPEYYRWTQWIFLRLFEQGLAYRTEAPVQWCPKDATVLANEQVVDGRCERCGTPVVQKKLEQWFFKITDYAERLLADFDRLESWPEHVITMQRNWIGRSEGAEVVFRCEEARTSTSRSSRPGPTPSSARPSSCSPPSIPSSSGSSPARRPRRRSASTSTASPASRPRSAATRTGRRPACRSGAASSTRSTASEIPMFVADYVLMEYGTGAIMAVPAPRLARLRVRQGLRPAGQAGDRGRRTPRPPRDDDGPALPGRRADGRLRSLRRQGQPRGLRRDRRVARRRGARRVGGQLPAARLAGLAPALLGRADPGRLLRGVRDRPRPRRPAPGRAARDRGLRARRARARSPRPRTGSRPSARSAAARRAARPTRWTPSSTPPGTSSATSTRATTSGPGTAPPPTTGCPSTSTSAASSTRSCT